MLLQKVCLIEKLFPFSFEYNYCNPDAGSTTTCGGLGRQVQQIEGFFLLSEDSSAVVWKLVFPPCRIMRMLPGRRWHTHMLEPTIIVIAKTVMVIIINTPRLCSAHIQSRFHTHTYAHARRIIASAAILLLHSFGGDDGVSLVQSLWWLLLFPSASRPASPRGVCVCLVCLCVCTCFAITTQLCWTERTFPGEIVCVIWNHGWFVQFFNPFLTELGNLRCSSAHKTRKEKSHEVNVCAWYAWSYEWKTRERTAQKRFYTWSKGTNLGQRTLFDNNPSLPRWHPLSWNAGNPARILLKPYRLTDKLMGKMVCNVHHPKPIDARRLNGRDLDLVQLPFNVDTILEKKTKGLVWVEQKTNQNQTCHNSRPTRHKIVGRTILINANMCECFESRGW